MPDHANTLLPEDVVLRLIDEWSEITLGERGQYQGIFHIKGGEPFVVPYLDSIAERMIEHKSLRFMMTTNGTHTKPQHLGLIQRLQEGLEGQVTIVVSLDGASASTHDYLRGSGQFEQTLVFLRFLRDEGIQTFLNCVLHAGNLHEIERFIELLNFE